MTTTGDIIAKTAKDDGSEQLSRVFKALGDPVRRGILEQLQENDLSVSQLAESYDMSMPGVLKHVRVLIDAGLISHEKTGRIRHCRLDEGPIIDAAVWLSKQTKYWQNQFNTLAALMTLPEQKEKGETKWPTETSKKKSTPLKKSSRGSEKKS